MSERREYSHVDRMMHGWSIARTDTPSASSSTSSDHVHPVQAAISRAELMDRRRHDDWLAAVQGISAPLQLRAELRAASRVSRLPCLKSSNLMSDTLMAANDTMDFCDFLGYQDGLEVSGQPHAMVEKRLGLL